nr:hypothetical protein [Tanacetum cinerariifolium]
MSKDPLIPRRNKVNWHYVRDDHMFTTIKLVSIHQNTQQFGAMMPIKLTNADIRNSNAYKEYYAVATGATPPKTKASVWKTKSISNTTVTPPPTAAAGPRLSTSTKGKQPATTSKAKSLTALSEVAMTEAQQLKLSTKRSLQHTHISQASGSGAYKGTCTIPGVLDVPTDESDEEISWKSSDEEGDDDDDKGDDGDDDDEEFIHSSLSTHDEEETRDEESFDPIPKTPENTDDEGNGEENLGTNVGRQEGHDEEDEEDELYRDININQGRGSSSVSSQFVTSMLNPTPDAGIESIFETTSQMDVLTPTSVATLPVFDHRLKTLEENFFEFMQTNQFAGAISSIPMIVHRYMDQRIDKAVKVAIQLQSDRLRDEAQAENDEFLKTIDENMQKIIKEQVKKQVKTSYAVAADLSEMELKKILIEKMEGNNELAKQSDSRSFLNELMDTLVDFFAFLINRLKVDTLTLELLVGPTYELMKGSCKSLMELKVFLKEVYKETTDQLDWFNPEGQQYPHNLLKPLPLIPNSRGRRVISFDHFINNDLEYLRGGASTRKYTTSVTKTKATTSVPSERRIIDVTELKIVKWHNYKHLDWITVHRDDDKLYKFKEGDSKRLRIQDIEDMLLLLVQGKLTNLTVKECFAFNVSIRMFTRSIVIQRRVEDLQLGNKDKQNRLMRINELHKFSNGTLTDVRTALDDRLKGIQMKYLPQTIWRKSDKERAAAMIQAIDKKLMTRRIMRSLERFVGGRLYEGDFRMLQRTI